ncbi:MAG TPA: sigma-70 family RNA polymerase sigma factor [Candidatus Limnocylindrales bacterium]|nr:sigma-70 family RNA polymerase sigma factor [Candidatus Limnocylindrales bacterium]
MSAFASSLTWELLAILQRDRTSDADRAVAEAPAESFEAVYRDHHRDVYRYVLLSLRRRDDADDVVADTFDRAFSAWRSGHGPAGRALPWLLVIARRIIVDRWRRERLIRWLPFGSGRADADPADGDDGSGRAEFWLWLDQLAKALPERQRDVVFLRYQRDLTDEEIGEILGLSASGVRTLVSRALAALRSHPELWS